MKKLLRKFRYGERGFTLIELLVVVAILGVLAAVMVPNVGKFMGTGTTQAANTEAHNVQTAVLATMADNNISGLDDGGTVGPGHASAVTSANSTIPVPVDEFFIGTLQATYTLDDEGAIISADAKLDGKWKDLTYDPTTGWVK